MSDDITIQACASTPIRDVPLNATTTHRKISVSINTQTSTESATQAEEREWHKIVSRPHVRRGLRRLAAEARRQIAAKETEEGGFVVE